jgi:hypothetical protein
MTVDNEVVDWIDNAFQIIVEEGNFFGNGLQVPNRQSKILMDFGMRFT